MPGLIWLQSHPTAMHLFPWWSRYVANTGIGICVVVAALIVGTIIYDIFINK